MAAPRKVNQGPAAADEPCRVLIAGKTKAGKSTLVNVLMGEDVAEAGPGRPITQGFHYYQRDALGVLDCEGFEQGASDEDIERLINEINRRAISSEERLHVAWLCVDETTPRLEPFHKRFIAKVSEHLPVIVVITQSRESARAQKLENAFKKQSPAPYSVVSITAKDIRLTPKMRVDAKGLSELLHETTGALETSGRRMAFIKTQRASLPLKRQEAQSLLKSWLAESGTVEKLAKLWGKKLPAGATSALGKDLKGLCKLLSEPFGGDAGGPEFRHELTHEMLNGLTAGPRISAAGMGVAPKRAAEAFLEGVGSAYIEACCDGCSQELEGRKLSTRELREIAKRHARDFAGAVHLPDYLPDNYPKVVGCALLMAGEFLVGRESDAKRRALKKRRLNELRKVVGERSLIGVGEKTANDPKKLCKVLMDNIGNEDAARWLLVDVLFADPFAPPYRGSKQVKTKLRDKYRAVEMIARTVCLEESAEETRRLRKTCAAAARSHALTPRRMASLGVIGAVLMVVSGGVGFAAAPLLGGMVGTYFLGLGGAAAVNGGLALLGGGALAAGGAGMAGGAAAIAGTFAMTGALATGGLGLAISKLSPKEIEGLMIMIQTQYAYALVSEESGRKAKAFGREQLKLVQDFKRGIQKEEKAKGEASKKSEIVGRAINWMKKRA